MTDGDRAFERIDHVMGKDLADETHVLLTTDPSVVVDGDAAALLASVLKGKKAIVYEWRDLLTFAVKYPENTTFFMTGTDHTTSPSFSEIIL